MQYANLQRDWEFVMPPMYSLQRESERPARELPNDAVVAMIHSTATMRRYRRARVPFVNIARTLPTAQIIKHPHPHGPAR